MAQSFSYKQTSINKWIETEANANPAELRARASIETVKEALKDEKNVTVVSAE